MIPRLIAYCATHRVLVLVVVTLAFLGGLVAMRSVPLDALPDLSDPQVIVFTDWMGRSPDLVEDQVTYPIVSSLLGAPKVVAVAAVATAAATGDAAPALYTQVCSVCHVAGVAGAPKFGDKTAWAPRVALGIDALPASVIKGKNAMPPRGGSAGSDADIKTAVSYMVNAAK